MYWLVMCVPGLALGIDVGWQPLPEGGMEYIIQIEPELLDSLRSGQPLQSDIPPQVRDIRAYRIVVGDQPVPRELPQSAVGAPASPGSAQGNEPGEPRPLPVEPEGHPITERPATFLQAAGAPAPAQESPAKQGADKAAPATEPSTPAMPLVLLSIGLFASLSGNVYLGWIGWEARRRCRRLLESSCGEPSAGEPAA